MVMKRRTLQSGEPAPAFDVQSLDGRGVALTGYLGRRLLLTFFRYGACPLCNLRMSYLIGAFPRWKSKGLDILAVFESPAERLLPGPGVAAQRKPEGTQSAELAAASEFSRSENSKELDV